MRPVKPRCPKCLGALVAEFTSQAIDHVKCLNCGWHEFVDFKTRRPSVADQSTFAQKGIAKSRRAPCLND